MYAGKRGRMLTPPNDCCAQEKEELMLTISRFTVENLTQG